MDTRPSAIFHNGFRELLSLAVRLGEKMKDKYIWTRHDLEQLIGYLIYFRDSLKKEKNLFAEIFGTGDFYEVRFFQKGYSTNSITFRTIVGNEVKKWVLKVGHRISPVVDFGDPSEPHYVEQYQSYLDILRSQTEKNRKLSYLVPEPHIVKWAVLTEEGIDVGRTLILQPFMTVLKGRDIEKKLLPEQKKALYEELQEFKKVCDVLVAKHKARPDLLGEGNLEVAQFGEEYHLVLLDMGFINLSAPIPITQTIMFYATVQTFYRMEKLLGT